MEEECGQVFRQAGLAGTGRQWREQARVAARLQQTVAGTVSVGCRFGSENHCSGRCESYLGQAGRRGPGSEDR